MAGVRDPAFWKRFSMAVHLDDEENASGRPELKHNDSWLARQNRKKSRRTYVCYGFWIGFFLFLAGVIAVVIWALNAGLFDGMKGDGKGSIPSR